MSAAGGDPGYIDALTYRSSAAYREAAISIPRLERVRRKLPIRSRAVRAQRRYERAHALRRAGRLSEAVAAYREALELAPERAAWHFELGVLLQRAGDWDAAAAAYAAATARAPHRARWQVERARCLASAGRWADAVPAYRAALEQAPGRAAWHFELGVLLQRAGDWDAAAEAYANAVNRGPRHAEWHARLGQCLVRAGRYAAAAEAWSAAVTLSPKRPEWHREHARAHRLAGDFDAAIPAYRAAISQAPGRAVWHYELGWALEQVEEPLAAQEAYREGLRADPTAKPLHAVMLASTPFRFPRRRRFVDFVAAHMDEIRERATDSEQPLSDPKIYFYWAQGVAEAPTVVQRCYRELQRWHAPEEIVLLDEHAWEHLAIPDITRQRVEHRLAHAAGVLRLELLSRLGGVWLDATCLVRRPLLPLVPELAPTGFFAFEREPNFPSSWLLISAPGNYLTAMWREAVHVYWKHFDRLLDYFVLGPLFEALCWLDPPFQKQWEATPRLSAQGPHAFGLEQFEQYEPTRYAQLLNSCFVQKLTYKDDKGEMTPGCMMARFIEHGLPDDAG